MAFDGKAFGQEMVEAVKAHISASVSPILARLAAVEGEIAAVPGRIAEAAKAMEGRALTRDDVSALIAAAIPAAPDLSGITKAIEAIRADVAAIPVARDGKDADPVLVKQMVAEAVAALPPAKDGASVEPAVVERMVADAVAKIPPALPGNSVTVQDVAPLIAETVERAVAALPRPRDGMDADPVAMHEAVNAAVAKAVSTIRVPKDGEPGREPTADEIAAVVAKHLDANPPPAGEPGTSVTLDDVAPLVTEAVQKAVSAIPVPKDGVSLAGALIDRGGELVVTLSDGTTKALGPVVGRDGETVKPEAVAEMVRSEVTKAVEHVKALGPNVDTELVPKLVDKAVNEAVAKIPPPVDGKDADPETVKALVIAAVAALPKPKDGKSVDLLEVRALVDGAVAEAVAEIPEPRDGADGKSVTLEDVVPLIVAEVQKAAAAIPVPRDGKSVDPTEVERMVAERVERAVASIPKAKDGLDAVTFLRDERGNLIVTMSDGTTKDLGQIDGADGFGFDDMTAEYDGERGLKIKFIRDGREKSFDIVLPVIIDRGVYKAGDAYQRGDAVTFGGGLWVCQAPTTVKPGETKEWRLAVKKGRDGKDYSPR